jgi:hypothetical protein
LLSFCFGGGRGEARGEEFWVCSYQIWRANEQVS